VLIVGEWKLRPIRSGDLLYTHGMDEQSWWPVFILQPASPKSQLIS
jgi:hypothetical protein